MAIYIDGEDRGTGSVVEVGERDMLSGDGAMVSATGKDEDSEGAVEHAGDEDSEEECADVHAWDEDSEEEGSDNVV